VRTHTHSFLFVAWCGDELTYFCCSDLWQFDMEGDISQRPALRSVVETLVDISGSETIEEAVAATTKNKDGEEAAEKVPAEELVPTLPRAQWCSFHTQIACSLSSEAALPDGISVLPEPSEVADFAEVLASVESEFHRICGPESEFLPTMPNPEDIVWTADETGTTAQENTQLPMEAQPHQESVAATTEDTATAKAQ